MSKQENTNSLEAIVVNSLKVPGVKVNRQEFLTHILASKVSSGELLAALDKGPVDAGISVNLLNKLAKSHIEKEHYRVQEFLLQQDFPEELQWRQPFQPILYNFSE